MQARLLDRNLSERTEIDIFRSILRLALPLRKETARAQTWLQLVLTHDSSQDSGAQDSTTKSPRKSDVEEGIAAIYGDVEGEPMPSVRC